MEVARPRELRNIEVVATTDNNSAILPAYFTDDQNSTEIPTVSTTTNSTVSSFIQLSNDSRLFFHDEEYHFEDVDSLDEDQRQRRRLRSARNEMNLLNADEEHITTMITTVFSTARNFLNNETIRANVVQYLTQKMRSFGLVTGNQIFHPIEFAALVRIKLSMDKSAITHFLRVTHFLLDIPLHSFQKEVKKTSQLGLMWSAFYLESFGVRKKMKCWWLEHTGIRYLSQAEWMITVVGSPLSLRWCSVCACWMSFLFKR